MLFFSTKFGMCALAYVFFARIKPVYNKIICKVSHKNKRVFKTGKIFTVPLSQPYLSSFTYCINNSAHLKQNFTFYINPTTDYVCEDLIEIIS